MTQTNRDYESLFRPTTTRPHASCWATCARWPSTTRPSRRATSFSVSRCGTDWSKCRIFTSPSGWPPPCPRRRTLLMCTTWDGATTTTTGSTSPWPSTVSGANSSSWAPFQGPSSRCAMEAIRYGFQRPGVLLFYLVAVCTYLACLDTLSNAA